MKPKYVFYWVIDIDMLNEKFLYRNTMDSKYVDKYISGHPHMFRKKRDAIVAAKRILYKARFENARQRKKINQFLEELI